MISFHSPPFYTAPYFRTRPFWSSSLKRLRLFLHPPPHTFHPLRSHFDTDPIWARLLLSTNHGPISRTPQTNSSPHLFTNTHPRNLPAVVGRPESEGQFQPPRLLHNRLSPVATPGVFGHAHPLGRLCGHDPSLKRHQSLPNPLQNSPRAFVVLGKRHVFVSHFFCQPPRSSIFQIATSVVIS